MQVSDTEFSMLLLRKIMLIAKQCAYLVFRQKLFTEMEGIEVNMKMSLLSVIVAFQNADGQYQARTRRKNNQ